MEVDLSGLDEEVGSAILDGPVPPGTLKRGEGERGRERRGGGERGGEGDDFKWENGEKGKMTSE